MRVLVDGDAGPGERESGSENGKLRNKASNPSDAAHPQVRLTTLNRLLD
jgi:hypothetical protein